MNLMRIITITAVGALVAGLLGCSWGDAQFEWPWNRQSAPATHPAWTSSENWPQRPQKPPEDPNTARSKDPGVATTRQAATRPARGRDEPIKIGETREITTSVLPIKGKFITVQEILHDSKNELLAIECDLRFEERVRRVVNRAIFRRINNELVFSEADARLSKPQKEHVSTQVDEILRNMIADAGGSKTRLEKLLSEEDLTLKELMEEHRRRITVRLYQQIKFLPAISITRQMLLGYYTKHKADFSTEKKVGMQLIAVMPNKFLPPGIGNEPTLRELGKARAAAKEEIDKADKLLKNGVDFTEVAGKFSAINPKTGGTLDPLPAGSLRQKEVEKAAFALEQGQRSGIVETPLLKNDEGKIVNYGGFYIVKAYEVQEGRIISFEDAQEAIDKILRAEQLKRLTDKFSERLYKESRIPQSPEFVETAIDEAIKRYWKPPTNP
ncbi:MAG: peptidyl-prolyl cis-trans isomerase [Phycisphaerae bacterium]|nr:peptidyl-prolyl cis-trans isomerase [Phycisphaerae bacterium]